MPRFHYLRYFIGWGRPAGPSLESLPVQCGVVRVPSECYAFCPIDMFQSGSYVISPPAALER
jgi:hypothetical protein